MTSDENGMGDPDAELVVRAARAEDREAVLAFTARTWDDDGDYIGEVWDAWLADTRGALLVAELAGAAVGVLHVRMLAEDEAWIEGIRVAPEARRRGVGRVLLSRALVAARERGATVARLFTDSDNLPAQALFDRFGFTRVAELVRYAADALAPDAPDAGSEIAALIIPGPEDFERIWAWLEQSNLAPFNGGLEVHDWTAYAVTEPRLRAYLEDARVTLLEAWESIQALAIVAPEPRTDPGAPPLLIARYVDGLADSIGRLAFALRRRATELGCAGVRLWLPDLLILRDAMDGAGYSDRGHGAIFAYSRVL